MNKRVIAAIAAGALALLGVGVLYMWAQGANDRAYDGAELVKVVRVTETVPQGTKAADLAASTELAKLPKDAVPEGAVTDLAEVTGLTTNAALTKGEVLLASRMVAPGDRGEGKPDVPEGYQEVTISLEGQRTVASQVKAGDHVGVIASYQSADGKTDVSKMVVKDVLVTRSSAVLNAESATGSLVTVAVKTKDATKIVNAMEFGKVWLTLQNADTDQDGDVLIDPTAAVR